MSRRKKAGVEGSEERRLNSAASTKGARAGEPSGPSPARTASAKGRPESLGRYERRSAGPDAKAVERSKRSSRGSPPAARPDWNGSPSTPPWPAGSFCSAGAGAGLRAFLGAGGLRGGGEHRNHASLQAYCSAAAAYH